MAHQTHALPWKVLASNLAYKQYQDRYTMIMIQDIQERKTAGQAKELAHFGRKLASQIQEFSVSERAKHESQERYVKLASEWTQSIPADDAVNAPVAAESKKQQKKDKSNKEVVTKMVYSDEIKHRYWVDQTGQRVSTFDLFLWSASAQDIESWFDGGPGHNNIDYGDVLKILMMEASAAKPALSAEGAGENNVKQQRNNMETLLLMANHPRVKIGSFVNMHHGHHFGVSRVAEEAVKAYIYLNVLFVMKEDGSKLFEVALDRNGDKDKLSRPNYMLCPSYQRLLSSVAGNYDGDAQCIVHKDFFYLEPWSRTTGPESEETAGLVSHRDVLQNANELKEYLKGVWRIMVTYDLVLREAGRDPDWEDLFSGALAHLYGIYPDI